MKVYFITKSRLIKAFILVIFMLLLCTVVLPYKDAVLGVFEQTRDIPIYCVDRDDKNIALTFDCAWGAYDIPKICDILDEYSVKATFFVVGEWMDKNYEQVKLLHTRGHEIANHSQSHFDMSKLKAEKIKSEIEDLNLKIEKLTGKKNKIFRAPYGIYNNTLVKTAKSLGQYVIQWNVDSLDWKDMGVQSILDRINAKTASGSIILLHNDTKYTVSALPSIIELLKSKGYRFVPVSDLIIKENYYIDNTGKQHSLIKEKNSLD